MKTLIRIIILISVINFSYTCFAGYGGRKTNTDAMQEEIEKQNKEPGKELYMRPVIFPRSTTAPPYEVTVTARKKSPESAKVLVIPAGDANTGVIAKTAEDMGIMARIFDKKVLELTLPKEITSLPFVGERSFYYARSDAQKGKSTEGIFISGYGAIFMMEVDFPLAPPKDEEREVKKADNGDIWKQTKNELSGIYQEFEGSEREKDSVRYKESFDEGKVKELKEKIIRNLKYSVNIRGIKADEYIVVSVKGASYSRGETSREVNILGHRLGMATQERSEEIKPKLPTCMTIRVKKDDVDDFAEGELDYEQFCKTAEVLIY